jgi:hypothetical protein
MQLKNDLLVAYRGYYVDLAFKENLERLSSSSVNPYGR